MTTKAKRRCTSAGVSLFPYLLPSRCFRFQFDGQLAQLAGKGERRLVIGVIHPGPRIRADVKRFATFREALLERGIFINSSGLACWFISAAHGPEQVLAARSAIDAAMDTIRN